MGKLRKRICTIGVVICSLALHLHAQVLSDSIFSDQIKTVLAYPIGSQNQYPIVEFGNVQQIQFEFDDLMGSFSNFSYIVLPCNPDWTLNGDLQPEEYLIGYNIQNISMGQNSYNTKVKYMHYSFQFPNRDVQLSISGNFLLVVYDGPNLAHKVFQKRFIVVENKEAIAAQIVLPRNSIYYDDYQELNCSVLLNKIDQVSNPIEQLRVVVSQNDDDKSLLVLDKPTFIRADELVYQNNYFESGNEFRRLDIRSIQFKTDNIAKIYDLDVTKVLLTTDRSNEGQSYINNPDFNGNFLIDVREYPDKALSADYIKVNFSLSPRYSYNTTYYLDGKAFNWKIDEDTKLSCDRASGIHSKTILLKQGLYNYRYYSIQDIDEKLHLKSEGNYFQSQQRYRVLLYFKPFGSKYFKCVTNYEFLGH